MTLNDFLFLSLCIVSLWRRAWLAVAFSFLYLLHMMADPYLSDSAYYIALILADSAIAMAITARTPSHKDLATASCAGLFLIINCYGLIIWFFGMEPDSYNYACSVAYIIMITSIIITGRHAHERRRRNKVRLDDCGSVLACRACMGVHNQEDSNK